MQTVGHMTSNLGSKLATTLLLSTSLLAANGAHATSKKTAGRTQVGTAPHASAKRARPAKPSKQKLAQPPRADSPAGAIVSGEPLGSSILLPRDRVRHIASDGQVYRTIDISQQHPSLKTNDLILAVSQDLQPQEIAMFERAPDGALRRLTARDLIAHANRRDRPSRELLAYTLPRHLQAANTSLARIEVVAANVEAAGFDLAPTLAPANDGVFQGFKARFVGEVGTPAWQARAAAAAADAISKVSPIAMYCLKRVSAHATRGLTTMVLPSLEVAMDADGSQANASIAQAVDAHQPGSPAQQRPMLRLHVDAKGGLAAATTQRLEIYALGTLAFYDLDHSALSVAIARDAPSSAVPPQASLREQHEAMVAQWKTAPAAFAKTNPNYHALLEAAFSRDMSEVAQPVFDR